MATSEPNSETVPTVNAHAHACLTLGGHGLPVLIPLLSFQLLL